MRQRGFSALSMLLSLVIIGIMVWIFFSYGLKEFQQQGSKAKTVPGAVKERTVGVRCMNNLRNARMAIEQYRDAETGRLPASLTDAGITGDAAICPTTKQPYKYDARTGRIWCETPGHEKYEKMLGGGGQIPGGGVGLPGGGEGGDSDS